jgi:hypothetical protein
MDLKYQSTFNSLNYITNKKNYSPLYTYFICILLHTKCKVCQISTNEIEHIPLYST